MELQAYFDRIGFTGQARPDAATLRAMLDLTSRSISTFVDETLNAIREQMDRETVERVDAAVERMLDEARYAGEIGTRDEAVELARRLV